MNSTNAKIGILGGTFNPVHFGHLAAAEEVKNRLGLDKVLFIPSFIPPHKEDAGVPPASHRLAMVRLAVQGNPAFEASDLEIARGGTSYTIDTIEQLERLHPGVELYFITGLDSFLSIQTWHRWRELLTRCRFVVLSRPGYWFAALGQIGFLQKAVVDLAKLDKGSCSHISIQEGAFSLFFETIPLYDISSTDIRARMKEGRSIKYLLPDAVETYIIENRFYA